MILHEKYLCLHVRQSYGMALNMLKFTSYNLSVDLSKGSKFSKTVYVRHSKQNHAMALRLNLVPTMYGRLVQEAENYLQREESYKKMLIWHNCSRKAH